VQDVNKETEKQIRRKIRKRKRLGAIIKPTKSHELDKLRAQARILRDQGIKDVLMLFDVEEPEDADRRGAGQFFNFIMISAYIYQFQRPILEVDGHKYVLVTYEDFQNAARVWFNFGQAFKINDKTMEVLRHLTDDEEDAPTAKAIYQGLVDKGSKIKGQSSVEYYLKVLYDKGYVGRASRYQRLVRHMFGGRPSKFRTKAK
jgi:hypothetical protein